MWLWSMRIGCCIPKGTNTPSEYVILTFSTATVVARTRLNAAMRVHCLYCSCRRERAQITDVCLSRLLVKFRVVSMVLRVRQLCLYFMRGAVFEPRPETSRYYPPLVSHALLKVLTPLWSRLGYESVLTWFRIPRQYSPVGVSKTTRSLKVKVLWDTKIRHQVRWLPEDGNRIQSTHYHIPSYSWFLLILLRLLTNTGVVPWNVTSRGLPRPRAGNI